MGVEPGGGSDVWARPAPGRPCLWPSRRQSSSCEITSQQLRSRQPSGSTQCPRDRQQPQLSTACGMGSRQPCATSPALQHAAGRSTPVRQRGIEEARTGKPWPSCLCLADRTTSSLAPSAYPHLPAPLAPLTTSALQSLDSLNFTPRPPLICPDYLPHPSHNRHIYCAHPLHEGILVDSSCLPFSYLPPCLRSPFLQQPTPGHARPLSSAYVIVLTQTLPPDTSLTTCLPSGLHDVP